eukprot:scaffold73580_cov19-Tisochrysis_lutea.AAC.1
MQRSVAGEKNLKLPLMVAKDVQMLLCAFARHVNRDAYLLGPEAKDVSIFGLSREKNFLQYFIQSLQDMGPAGYVAYAVVYAVLELLALPGAPQFLGSLPAL